MKRSGILSTMLAIGMLATVYAVGCKDRDHAAPGRLEQGDTPMPMTLTSSAFDNGAPIPTRYSGDGEDVSPPLSWSGLPEGTVELALICDDPDAPRPQPWVHWVIYKIPATATGLPEAVPAKETLAAPAGAVQGVGTSGDVGYRGPAPPRGHGVHHYHFRLYALGAAVDLPPKATKEDLLDAMRGHIFAEAELVGTYER